MITSTTPLPVSYPPLTPTPQPASNTPPGPSPQPAMPTQPAPGQPGSGINTYA
ncbi:hypothetical protein [Aquitalea denitrificans]|nr:hypothetical protein [Aquitalea denitrificans]